MMLTGEVFVSHTADMALFPRGRSFVQAALDAVGRAGMAAVDMRYFAAREGKPADHCRARVRGCEVYVAVVGFRYGTVVPGEAVSFTELEFGEAGAAGLPRLVFLLAEGADRPDVPADRPEVPADQDRALIEGFRRRLCEAGLVVREFGSAAALELEVFHALADLAGGIRPLGPTAGTAGARFSLPPDTSAFTGRSAEMQVIADAVDGAAAAGGVAGIHAIEGMPGVGKTALAVHAAHRLRERFPDRQLFIDLQGHTPGREPVPPEEALAGLLAAAGVDARYLPPDVAGRAGLWRDRMAGQRAVVVLDNAAGSAQVTPLLPGGDCLVLVTSRRHLADLPGPVVNLPLDTFPMEQGLAMFTRLAPRASSSGAGAVADVVRLAGGLPLAISLLARVYARHPSWTLADLAAETEARVLTLAAEKDSVAAAFEVSYRYLPPDSRSFFRFLGVHPGTVAVDAYAAAALVGVPLAEAAEMLDALHGEGLLTETAYRRYGMHDLIRRYARDLAAADPAGRRSQALERLLDYYQYTATAAQVLLVRRPQVAMPGPAEVPGAVPALPDRDRALVWSRDERDNLLACLDQVTEAGQHGRVVALTAAIAAVLRQDGPWAQAITRHHTAAESARHLGNPVAEGNALTELAETQRLIGNYPAAARAAKAALSIYRDHGDRIGEGNALYALAETHWLTAEYHDAAHVLETALGIYRDHGQRLGEANALTELGIVRWLTGDYRGSAGALESALGIYRDLRHRHGEADALNNLASVRRCSGDYPDAVSAARAALDIFRGLGDRLGEGAALYELAQTRRCTGDYPGAASSAQAALIIFRDLRSRMRQADALTCLAALGRLAGNYADAATALETALGYYRDIGDQNGEGDALNETATLHLACGKPREAAAYHQRALNLARQSGNPRQKAFALAGLGRCATVAGNTARALARLRQAHKILSEIGDAEALELADELRRLKTAPMAGRSRLEK